VTAYTVLRVCVRATKRSSTITGSRLPASWPVTRSSGWPPSAVRSKSLRVRGQRGSPSSSSRRSPPREPGIRAPHIKRRERLGSPTGDRPLPGSQFKRRYDGSWPDPACESELPVLTAPN